MLAGLKKFWMPLLDFVGLTQLTTVQGDLLVIINAVAQQRVVKGQDLSMDLLCPSQAY